MIKIFDSEYNRDGYKRKVNYIRGFNDSFRDKAKSEAYKDFYEDSKINNTPV